MLDVSVKIQNPDFATRVRESFARQPFMSLLGAELVAVEPGYVEMRLSHRDELTQQHGFFHGGVIGALADNACGYASFTSAPADHSILTVEYKLNLLAPAARGLLIARGRIVRPGRTLVVSAADLFVMDEKTNAEKKVATALATMMLMAGMDDAPTAKNG